MAGVDGSRRPAAQRWWSGERRASRCSQESTRPLGAGETGFVHPAGAAAVGLVHRPRRGSTSARNPRWEGALVGGSYRRSGRVSAAMVGRCNWGQAIPDGSLSGRLGHRPAHAHLRRCSHLADWLMVAVSRRAGVVAGEQDALLPSAGAGRSGPGLVSLCRSGRPVLCQCQRLGGPRTNTTSGLTLPAWSARRIPSMTATAGRRLVAAQHPWSTREAWCVTELAGRRPPERLMGRG
jgi:hypothetical protein